MDALYAGLGVLLACVGLVLLLGVVMYGGSLLDHLRGRRDYKLRKDELKQRPQPTAVPSPTPAPTTMFTEQPPYPGPVSGPQPPNLYK